MTRVRSVSQSFRHPSTEKKNIQKIQKIQNKKFNIRTWTFGAQIHLFVAIKYIINESLCLFSL